jgi:hypothetical protein
VRAVVMDLEANAKPPVVCICGSGKFWEEIQRQRRRLTLEGKIVVGPEVKADNAPDADRDGSLAKPALDQLHFRKIDLSSEVLVVDIDTMIPGSYSYIGPSTTREIAYATSRNIPVTRLSEINAPG